ncbi:MAG: glycosyl hydrolase 53 family protein [Clostridia bacterium]|nr:glycosyl hydrolase 53 family protein [Clostridia bacterium]
MNRTDFLWGVNTHCDFYPVYRRENAEKQLKLIRDMGSKIVRVNFYNFDFSDFYIPLANACGLKVMLVVDGYLRDISDNYNAAAEYELYRKIADRYDGNHGFGKIDFIQINNEVDVFLSAFNPKFGDGETIEEFPQPMMQKVYEHFANASAGIRAAKTDVKIVINAGWKHYGMFLYMNEKGIDFDLLGWDWYSDMATAMKREGKRPFQLAETLHDLFGKDIIVCETNIWTDSLIDTDDVSNWDDLFGIIDDAVSYPFVKGLIIYECCDEMPFEQEGTFNREAHFGLVKADKDGNMLEVKPVYYKLKDYIMG